MMKKRVVLSTATGPLVTPRSFRAPAIRAKGLSSSFQARTSAGMPSVSRTDGSSNTGVMMIGSPVAGITATVGRSDLCQSMPVK